MNIRTMPNGLFWSLWSAAMGAAFVLTLTIGDRVSGAVELGLALAFTAVVLALAVLASIRCVRHRKGGLSPATRRYMLRFSPAMLAYVVALFVSGWIFKATAPQGALAVAIAAAPALPVIAAIWAVARFVIEQEDEFERMALMQSQLLGLAVTLSICTVVGFLDSFGVGPHVPLWVAFPLHAVCGGLASIYVRARYR